MPTPIALKVEQLKFTWPAAQNKSTKPLLSIDALSVAQGGRLFIQGASGSGKSTLLGLLAGIHPIQQGDIRLLGQSLKMMSASARDRFRAQHIGYIFQQLNLLPYLNVLENVQIAGMFAIHSMSNNASLQRAKSVLQQLNIAESLYTQPVSHLSIGQQQRVAIARALFLQPQIIIADEPTSALDAQNRDDFMQTLIASSAELGATLVFVSHDPSLRDYFEQVLVLADGDLSS
ncbi:ABC transporter ATP-binding protein [Alteromonadaceae bacterium BrNp21-10]|nr:ABC transporter ATP-binding protein [Alteromonadaceae bacterium BrNp21-10]